MSSALARVLTKPYKHWEAGIALTSDQDEFAAYARLGGSLANGCRRMVYVNAERIAELERDGYFAAQAAAQVDPLVDSET